MARAACLAALPCLAPCAAASPVRVGVDPLRLTHAGELRVSLESTDGRARLVELRVSHDPDGLRALPVTAAVPASGVARARLRVFRADAAWGTRHAVDVVALEGETPLGLGSALIDVAPDPALAPRLRPALVALGLLLLAAAVVTEWRWETAT